MERAHESPGEGQASGDVARAAGVARPALAGWVRAAVGLAILALLVAKAVRRPMSHDEHQFVAPAALWWREGLHPYVDFAHFHAPYGVYLKGLAVAVSEQLLLGVRLLSVLCAAGFLALVHRALARTAARRGVPAGTWIADAAVLLLVAQPAFAYTTGLAWNHDDALLAAFGGLLAAGAGLRADGCRRRLLLAGALLAVATGLRFSMAPAALALVVGVGLAAPARRRARAVGAVIAGGVLGALPFLLLVALAPSAAWFGNLEYAGLNTAFRAAQGFPDAMDLPGKLAWLRHTVLTRPGVVALELLVVLALLRLGARGLCEARRAQPELVVGGVMWLGLLVGALAPTPSWPQYVHAPVAWLVPLTGWALLLRDGRPRWLLPGAAVTALLFAPPHWREPLTSAAPTRPGPLAVHAAGEALAAHVGDARVFTRLPIVPLEGGARVDPALASGPFGWRVAPLLEPALRERHGLVGPDDARAHLARHPVRAVLVAPAEEPPSPLDALDLDSWSVHELPAGLLLFVAPSAAASPGEAPDHGPARDAPPR